MVRLELATHSVSLWLWIWERMTKFSNHILLLQYLFVDGDNNSVILLFLTH